MGKNLVMVKFRKSGLIITYRFMKGNSTDIPMPNYKLSLLLESLK
jgi:hypothetical protein